MPGIYWIAAGKKDKKYDLAADFRTGSSNFPLISFLSESIFCLHSISSGENPFTHNSNFVIDQGGGSKFLFLVPKTNVCYEAHKLSKGHKMNKSIVFLHVFIFLLTLPINTRGQNQLQSEILNRGAVEIGQLEWQLKPGWWQYHPSCDARKWISYSQVFEPRTDYRASCEQQIHDYETVVAPTVSKTVEAEVPADGAIIVLYEIMEGKDYDKEPWINSSLFTKTGVETNMLYNMVGGKKKLLKTEQYPTASAGDKVVLKVDARLRNGSGKRFLQPQGVILKAYLIPTNGSVNLGKPQPGTLYYTDKECN